MKNILPSVLLVGLLLASNSSQALVSYCGYGPGHDGFYHRASLGLLEISYPFVTTWMETHASGPLSPSLYSAFYNTLNSWHFFTDMPPGDYLLARLCSFGIRKRGLFLEHSGYQHLHRRDANYSTSLLRDGRDSGYRLYYFDQQYSQLSGYCYSEWF